VTAETRYARLGDLHLAYQVLGEGPPDILPLLYWIGDVEAQWDVPPLAAFLERLASFGRVITFDKRGTGLSDPVSTSELPILEAWTDDAIGVLDSAGSRKSVVIGNIGGGLIATTLAATHPDRVSSLVLVDCFARSSVAPDFPIGDVPAVIDDEVDMTEARAGQGVLLDLLAPSLADDPILRRAWSRFERHAVSPGAFKAIVRFINQGDVREVLPAIRVPTLVIHRAGGRRFGAAHGRYLAEHIPNARYVELPGDDKLIWAGDAEAILDEIQDFVTGVRPAPASTRVLATVLFTDIVGSTKLAAEMGDVRWRTLLDEHNRVARHEISRFGGREIKTVGDGILATFDGPARAVRCAAGIRDGERELDLEVRAGLHTGEIELQGDDVAGLAVHIGARIAALAGPGEILVSSTVHDLVVGSGLAFEDRGRHELKGVPDDWQLFAVRL
jgi:class 3 adenylate cyclase